MNRGDVIYFFDHEFTDGGHADKLAVIISACSGDSIVFLLTTSKGRDSNSHGCQPMPKKYFIKSGKYKFNKDTWIDLARNIYPFQKDKVQRALDSGAAKIITTLPEQEVNAIRNCLIKHALESLTRESCEILGITPKW